MKTNSSLGASGCLNGRRSWIDRLFGRRSCELQFHHRHHSSGHQVKYSQCQEDFSFWGLRKCIVVVCILAQAILDLDILLGWHGMIIAFSRSPTLSARWVLTWIKITPQPLQTSAIPKGKYHLQTRFSRVILVNSLAVGFRGCNGSTHNMTPQWHHGQAQVTSKASAVTRSFQRWRKRWQILRPWNWTNWY